MEVSEVVLDISQTVINLLDYFGFNENGEEIGQPKGETLFRISCTQAESKLIQKRVNRLVKPHDKFCKRTYVKNESIAYYDIVS